MHKKFSRVYTYLPNTLSSSVYPADCARGTENANRPTWLHTESTDVPPSLFKLCFLTP